jgi:dienelactone hydrolase
MIRHALPLALALSLPLGLIAGAAAAQSFNLAPETVILQGDPVELRLSGLPPKARVEVAAERRFRPDGPRLTSSAAFVADAAGTVDLTRDAPVAGSYAGADAAGLFWSLTPAADPGEPWPEAGVRLKASIDGKVVATTTLKLVQGRADTTVIPLEGFPGAKLYRPAGDAPAPVVIILGGSEGGDAAGRRFGPKLAARGFAAVSLPYFSPNTPQGQEVPGLPVDHVDIPIDRLDALHTALKGRGDIDAARVALFGGSKGSEYALLAASRFAWVDAVVAYVPSDLVWEGFSTERLLEPGVHSSYSYQGRPVAFTPFEGIDQVFAPGRPPLLSLAYEAGRAAHPDRAAAARIPVERFKGRLLLIAGEDDRMWPSAQMARNIQATRDKAGLTTQLLAFPGAGHLVSGDGYTPVAYDGPFQLGGSLPVDARAQAQGWTAAIAFLKAALKP